MRPFVRCEVVLFQKISALCQQQVRDPVRPPATASPGPTVKSELFARGGAPVLRVRPRRRVGDNTNYPASAHAAVVRACGQDILLNSYTLMHCFSFSLKVVYNFAVCWLYLLPVNTARKIVGGRFNLTTSPPIRNYTTAAAAAVGRPILQLLNRHCHRSCLLSRLRVRGPSP